MKIIFKIISMSFLLLGSSFSQTIYSSQNATASAYLVVPLSITSTIGDLDFGNIFLTGSATKIDVSPREGKLFVVSGHPGRDVTFSFDDVQMDNASWAVTAGGVVDELTFVPQVELEDGSKIKSGKSKELILNGSIGQLKVWVGGKINIGARQEVGDYIGRFTLNVNY